MTVTGASAACPDATTFARGYSLTRSDGVVEHVLPQPDASVVSLTDTGGILTESVRFQGLLLLRVTAVSKNAVKATTVYEYLGPEFLKIFPLKSGADLTLAQRVTVNGKPLERKFEISVKGNEKITLGECSYDTTVVEYKSTQLDGSGISASARVNYASLIKYPLVIQAVSKEPNKADVKVTTSYASIRLK